jgi:hypothetical protein
MQCKLSLIFLTKQKTTICYCELFGYGGKTLSTHNTNDLIQVSVPAEDGSQQLATFTQALRRSSTFVPTHAPSGLVLSYPLQVLQGKQKQPNFINNKEGIHKH